MLHPHKSWSFNNNPQKNTADHGLLQIHVTIEEVIAMPNLNGYAIHLKITIPTFTIRTSISKPQNSIH